MTTFGTDTALGRAVVAAESIEAACAALGSSTPWVRPSLSGEEQAVALSAPGAIFSLDFHRRGVWVDQTGVKVYTQQTWTVSR